jgi:hypothetical protein
VSDVDVGAFEDETEADTAAGYLRSLGIEARVTYRATMGVPRQVSPIRVVAPFGQFEVRVPADDAPRARRALTSIGGPSERPRRFRWLGWVLVLVWVLPLLIGAIVSLGLRF